MLRLIYSLLFYVAMPLVLLRLFIRSLRAPAYRRRIAERFGYVDKSIALAADSKTLWLHAVSVGETVAAAPLVRALQARYPELQLFLTTMTPTGSARVRSLFGDSVFHSYLPYDLPGAVHRFIERVNPSLLILMETELWPNLIHGCRRHRVKLLLANARLSEKSAAGYQRFGGLTRGMLQSIDRIAAQAQPDAERLIALGADPERIGVTGSLKFHVDLHEAALPDNPAFVSIKGSGRPVMVAASTREGEETLLLPAFHRLLEAAPELLIVVVPRHPERFDEVATLCADAGFKVQRRSENQSIAADTQLVIGDSMGEMLAWYGIAALAFVGGSLVDTGCQNVLEPAALGLPVLVGPSQFNFATICVQLEEVGGLQTVADADALAAATLRLLQDEARRRQMGEAARQLVAENQQALPRLLALIEEMQVL